ncbi:MAG TPA: hypothetical protein VH765_08455 [Xanthobacteraceae bacterium]
MHRACCAAVTVAMLCVGVVQAMALSGASDPIKLAQGGSTAKPSAGKKAPAAPKAQAAWRFRGTGVPTLEFGSAGTETVISISCQPGSGLVRVVSHVGSRGLRPGDGAAIRLTNGRAKFEVAGTAFSAEAGDDVNIAGTTKIDARLFALFRAGDSMVLEVPGRKRTLPAASGRAGADALEKACGQASG